MSKFIFAVSGQFLDLLTPTRGISDTINANSAEFNFRSPDWEGTSKWAHFSNPSYNDGASVDFALINDAIDSSRGLNLPSGIWEVWVHGEVIANGEVIRRLVTETQTIRIIESNIEDNEPLGELNPSVAEQIDAKATEALNAKITSATADVDSGIGTPSATVEITGEDRTKNLAFHFHNLKGEKGDTGEKGDKGDTGAQGETGQTGETGATPDLTIGTVIGGETADATITGTAENPVLNLVLPKGDKGDTGETGQTGPAGEDGDTPHFTIGTVEAGDQAGAAITGTDEDPVLNLVLPKGNKGDKGDTPHFTIGTVEDGASSSAAATITGTDEDPVLNLVLPRGPEGPEGPIGPLSIFWVDPFSETPTTQAELEQALAAGRYPIIEYAVDQYGNKEYLLYQKKYHAYAYPVMEYYHYLFSSMPLSNYAGYFFTCELEVDVPLGGGAPVEAWSSVSSISPFANSGSIASEYDSTSTYAVGKYVTYNSKLYRCKNKISNPMAWQSYYWQEVNLDERFDPFVITCLPNASDYSGNTNRPISDVEAAWVGDRRLEVCFKFNSNLYVYTELTRDTEYNTGYIYPCYRAYVVDDSANKLIVVKMGSTNSSLQKTYTTEVYDLVSPDPIVYSGASDPNQRIDPCPTTYDFGTLAALTITGLNGGNGKGQYRFSFSCPSASTTVLTFPSGVRRAGDTTLEAGAYYEVDIWNKIARIKKIETV